MKNHKNIKALDQLDGSQTNTISRNFKPIREVQFKNSIISNIQPISSIKGSNFKICANIMNLGQCQSNSKVCSTPSMVSTHI